MRTQTIIHWLPLIAVLAVWELIWKGLALWRAGRRNEVAWFVAILVVNSVGVLPIIYLLLAKSKPAPETTAGA